MASRWNKNETEMLIGLYEQYPNLYDVRDYSYSSRHKREIALTEIAEEMCKIRPNTTIDEIRMKIRTLRTQYSAEKQNINKMKLKGIYTDDRCKPKLWCFDMLKFFDNCKTEGESFTDVRDNVAEKTKILVNRQPVLYSFQQAIEPDVVTLNMPSSNDVLKNNNKPKPNLKRKKSKQYFMETNDLIKKTISIIDKPQDEHQIFADYIASEFRLLKTEKNKMLLRRKIQKIITEIVELDDKESGSS